MNTLDLWNDGLSSILADRQSGSMQLLKNFLALTINADPEIEAFKNGCAKLQMHFGDMAVINNALGLSIEILKSGTRPKAVATKLQKLLQEINSSLLQEAKKTIPKKSEVLTISNSGTLVDILTALEFSRVFVMKSDPGGEGGILFETIKEKTSAELVEDSKGYELVKSGEVDAILSSCDLVVPNVGFVNKAGTKKLCEVTVVPVYVCANSLKLVKQPPKNIKSPLLEWIRWRSIMRLVSDKIDAKIPKL